MDDGRPELARIICYLQGYVFRFRDPQAPQNSLQLDLILGTKRIYMNVQQAIPVLAPSALALVTQGPQSVVNAVVHTILAFHSWALINQLMMSQTILIMR